jgi:hypothetical protein
VVDAWILGKRTRCVAYLQSFACTLIQAQKGVAFLDHLRVVEKDLEEQVDLTGRYIEQVNGLVPTKARVVGTEKWRPVGVHLGAPTNSEALLHSPA